MELRERVVGGIIGLAIGDALGVPVEFKPREILSVEPVTGFRGFGTHRQPKGTWSDDTSLTLATIAGFLDAEKSGEAPLNLIAKNFIRWYQNAEFTPFNVVFDIGNTTRNAILNLISGKSPTNSGLNGYWTQANGSLMRILPASLYYIFRFKNNIKRAIKEVHRVSAITHSHHSCLIACGMYTLILKAFIDGKNPNDAYEYMVEKTIQVYTTGKHKNWLNSFSRILDREIPYLESTDIESTGYVVNSLEASLWAFLTTSSFKEAVLRAINLGGDTDTIGAITGGMAGTYYGFSNIPKEWKRALVKSEYLLQYAVKFAEILNPLT